MQHIMMCACWLQEWFEYIWPFGGTDDTRSEELDG